MIFVDTGAWFAAFVSSDIDHKKAQSWLSRYDEKLITTDYIFDELLTLMKHRGEFGKALEIGEPFFTVNMPI
jgi:predicted nucleic acid-binding protein